MKKKKKIELPIKLYPEMENFFNSPERFKILKAGRRSGKTLSVFYHLIKLCLKDTGKRYLYIDVSYTNIKMYIEKFVLPILELLPNKLWNYNKSTLDLTVNGNIIRNKTITNIKSVVGDGVHVIIVNECSAVFEIEFFLDNILMPMLSDYPDSKLIAVGCPIITAYKRYKEIVDKNISNPKWLIKTLSTYDNPYLSKENIDEIFGNLDDFTKNVELYANFPEKSVRQWVYAFNQAKHVKEVSQFHSNVSLSFDFNVNPMTCAIFQVSNNEIRVLDELVVENTDLHKFLEVLRDKLKKNNWNIFEVTGDASGSNKSVANHINHYTVIQQFFKLNINQLRLRTKNMEHETARVLINSVFQNYNISIDFKCKHIINSLNNLMADDKNEMIRGKHDHCFDIVNYIIQNYLPNFIKYQTKKIIFE